MALLPLPKKIVLTDDCSTFAPPDPTEIRYTHDEQLNPEGYVLDISPEGVTIASGGGAGRFYAQQTLNQLIAEGPLRRQQITDAPDFPVRGVMLDISRNKVPTLESLKGLVDLLAGMKINHLQLYVEGYSYEYKSFKSFFPEETPITPSEIRALDDYCQERYIELVPNHNTLGHMSAWLALPAFASLRETEVGISLMGRTMPPSTLHPYDNDALKLVETLTDELLASFSSDQYNAGLDEPFELGQGKSRKQAETSGLGTVYADYVQKMHQMALARGKRMMMWGDIVAKHPEALSAISKDILLLEWGYEATHPFKQRGEALKKAGFSFLFCPGTSAWTTFTGRTDNMLQNIENAAVNGLACGAKGLLITDWGDGGHLHYPGVSYPGYAWGAALAWNANSGQTVDLAGFLNRHVFMDTATTPNAPSGGLGLQGMGEIALAAGRYCHLEEFPMLNMTLSHLMLQIGLITKERLEEMLEGIGQSARLFVPKEDADYLAEQVKNRKPFDFERLTQYLRVLTEAISKTHMGCPMGAVLADEFRNGLRMAELGVRIRQYIDCGESSEPEAQSRMKNDLRTLTEVIQREHRRLWLLRNKPGGLERSLAPFARLLEVVS